MTPQKLTAPLPPEWYWQDEWLEREQREVFARNWYFAGFKQDLAKHNDYVSFTVAGVPVIVRNMKDKLVAFRNICSHRHSTIHPRGCGSAMFRCPYHGWTYDEKGVPVGIPDNARSFGFDKEAKCELALDAVAVETCGNFVFVRLAEHGPSLNEWLGSLAAKLEHASALFTEIYGREDKVWNCNWKLAIDITLEDYHHPYVHPSTYYHHLGREGVASAAEDQAEGDSINTTVPTHTDFVGLHSHSHATLSSATRSHLEKVAGRLKLPRSSMITDYNHFFIFPNLTISVDDGVNSYISRYEPLTATQTRFEGWVMMGMPAEARLRDGIIWQTMTRQWKEFTFSIIDEDRGACEIVQKGVAYASRPAVLGSEEGRIRHFQSGLYEQMKLKKKAA